MEFQERFATERACREYLVASRWPEGFVCPSCGSSRAIGEPLTGHDDWVGTVAVGELDGRPIAVSGGHDGTMRMWDLAAGSAIGEPLTGHHGTVTTVAVGELASRPIAVSGGQDGTMRVWDVAGPSMSPPPGYRKLEDELEGLREEIGCTRSEKAAAIVNREFEKAAILRDQERRLINRKDEFEAAIPRARGAARRRGGGRPPGTGGGCMIDVGSSLRALAVSDITIVVAAGAGIMAIEVMSPAPVG